MNNNNNSESYDPFNLEIFGTAVTNDEEIKAFMNLPRDQKYLVHAIWIASCQPKMKTYLNVILGLEQNNPISALFLKELKGLINLMMSDLLSVGKIDQKIARDLLKNYNAGKYDKQAIEDFGNESQKKTADLHLSLFNLIEICHTFSSMNICFDPNGDFLVSTRKEDFGGFLKETEKMLSYQKFSPSFTFNAASFSNVTERMKDTHYAVLQMFITDFFICKTQIQLDDPSLRRHQGDMSADISLRPFPLSVQKGQISFFGSPLKADSVLGKNGVFLTRFITSIWNPFNSSFVETNSEPVVIHHQTRSLDPLRVILENIKLDAVSTSLKKEVLKSLKDIAKPLIEKTIISDLVTFLGTDEGKIFLINLGLPEENYKNFLDLLDFMCYLKFLQSSAAAGMDYDSVKSGQLDYIINTINNSENGVLTRSSKLRGNGMLKIFEMLRTNDAVSNSKISIVTTNTYKTRIEEDIGCSFLNGRKFKEKETGRLMIDIVNFPNLSSLEKIIVDQHKLSIVEPGYFIRKAVLAQGKKVMFVETSVRENSLVRVMAHKVLYESVSCNMKVINQDIIAIEFFAPPQTSDPTALLKDNKRKSLNVIKERRKFIQSYLNCVYTVEDNTPQIYENLDYSMKSLIPVMKNASSFDDELDDDSTYSSNEIIFSFFDKKEKEGDSMNVVEDNDNNNNNNVQDDQIEKEIQEEQNKTDLELKGKVIESFESGQLKYITQDVFNQIERFLNPQEKTLLENMVTRSNFQEESQNKRAKK